MIDHGRDIIVLGCSRDVETLLRHLAEEAPVMLGRVVVIDPRPGTRERVQQSGVGVCCGDPHEIATLARAAVDQAAIIVSLSVPGTETAGSDAGLVRRVRGFNPRARVVTVATDGAHESLLRLAGADDVVQIISLEGLPRVLRRSLRDHAGHVSAGAATGLWRRLRSRQFAVLIAIAVIDAIVFVIPLMPTLAIVAVLFAPHWLRRAAAFLDGLAEPEAT